MSDTKADGAAARYRPIAEHALIGNQYTCALVSTDANMVWCCLPELHDPSVFAALLDARRGGCFRVSMVGGSAVSQRYIDLTAALVTRFEAPDGRLAVIDFMPMRGSIEGCEGPDAPAEIHRLIRCERGSAEVAVEWSPRLDYARGTTAIEPRKNGFVARCGSRQLSLGGLSVGEVVDTDSGPEVLATLQLQEGETLALITRWDTESTASDPVRSERALKDTVEAWRNWMRAANTDEEFAWAGAYEGLLLRSVIVLKMLTHPETGAIAAAPTASLPEDIGGERNWDYRYAWIRDASFTVQALLTLGHAREARDFVEFAERAAMDEARAQREVRIMYDLHGRVAPEEEELDHFEGYKGSRPVRIGNGARLQTQHDVYGELIDSAYELVRRGEKLEPEIYEFLSSLADMACEVRHEPDDGIWEFRADPKHYTYSKLMLWVALDRAVRMAEEHGLEGDVARWRAARDELRKEIEEKGYREEVGAFVMAYDSEDLDAANLRIPLLEFLPCSDPRVQGTINRTLEQLTEDDMVYRYKVDDGLSGDEGTFGLCTFWMIEVLALSGRLDEARHMFERMAQRANHAGLYSEEIAPGSGQFLGNFPQAFTHIGFINGLLYLSAAEGTIDGEALQLEGMPSKCSPPGPRHAARQHADPIPEGTR
jgi:GH15 family glucan-1,4-alpha-glucosidase